MTDTLLAPPGGEVEAKPAAVRAVSWEAVLALAAIAVSAAVILAHMALIPAGSWGGDEYTNFGRFRDFGLSWYWLRTVTWSPRPISDGLLFLYALAVNAWHSSLITPFLGLLWLSLIGATLGSAWQRGAPGALFRMALASVVLVTFLTGHDVNSLFLWPMGAGAYVLDLIGVAIVTVQVISGGLATRSGRWLCTAGLVLAAASSETGLFFALAFPGAMLLVSVPGLVRRRAVAERERLAWFLVAFVVAVAIAALLLYIVVTNPGRGIDQSSVYFHNFRASLAGTCRTAVREIILGGRTRDGFSTPAWLACMALFFIGAVGVFSRKGNMRASGRHIGALALGLAGCYLMTVFAVHFEYGQADHQPQTAYRKCLILIALLPAAWLAVRYLPQLQRRLKLVSFAALLGVPCIAAASRAPLLIASYRLMPEIIQARAMTWQSAAAAGDTLHFAVPPSGVLLLGQIPAMPGHIVRDAPGVEPWENGIMEFFRKPALEFANWPPRDRPR